MMRALNTAGTGMVAQQINLDVIANNLANVNTTGYKSLRAEFQDLMYQTFRASGSIGGGDATLPQASQVGLGTRFSGNNTNFQRGSLEATGETLHMAITGEGFFQVTKPDGTQAYTRDGSFKLDANGRMVTSDGYLVEPQIDIEAGSTGITVSAEGIITALGPGQNEPQQVGQLILTTFPNPSGLTRIGQNLYMAGGGSGEPIESEPGQNGTGTIAQRFLEASNVQMVEEMVRMITAQRAYEINSKAIQTSDDMLAILANLKR